jgi:putative transposase
METRAADDTRPVIIMADDEGRFGRMHTLKRCWAPKPLRPMVARQLVRKSLYVFAAVCPPLGHIPALLFPYANSQMRTRFLAHVAAELAAYCMVMLVDRAGWHLRHHVPVPDNIRLLPQRPGSPALNPAEHLWEDVRENETANHHFDTLELLETALCEGLNRLASDPERLRSMTNFPYMPVSL